MDKNGKQPDQGKFREEAEAILKNRPGKKDALLSQEEARKLIHELELHQIELELQVNELIREKNHPKNFPDKHSELYDIECDYLLQSEDRYTALFQHNHSVMLLVDPETGEIKEANPSACKFYGWSHDELLKKNISEINTLSPEEIKLAMQKSTAEIRNKFFFSHRKASGEVRDVEVYSGPIKFGNSTLLYSIVHDITESKLTLQALKLSSRKWETLISASPDGIGMVSLDGKMLMMSDKLAIMHGFSVEEKDEFIGSSVLEYIDTTQHEMLISNIQKLLTGETKFNITNYIAIKKDKKNSIHIELFSTLLRDQNGNPESILYFERDITERRQAEDTLRVSEEKYRNIFETVQDVYYESLIDGTILEVSPSIEIISKGQYTRNELIGQSLIGFYTNPDERDRLFSELFKNGRVNDYELSFRNKDGSIVPISISSAIVRDAGGNPLKISGLMRDITERKQTEEDLLKFRTISEQANYGTAISTPEGKLVYVNDSMARMHGWEVDEMLGENISILHNEDTLAHSGEIINRLNIEGSFLAEEVSHVRKDGSVFSALVSVSVIYDNDHVPQFNSATVIDISAVKESERALKESEADLNHAQRMADMGSWETNFVTGKTKWSENQYRMFGLEPFKGKISGDDFKKMVHPGDLHLLEEKQQEIIRGEKNAIVDLRIIMPDGNIKWIQNNIVPIFNGDAITGIKGVNIDITKERNQKEEIKDLNANLENKIAIRTQLLAETNESLQKEIEERNRVTKALEEALDRLKKIASSVPGMVYQYRLRPDGSSCFPYASDGVCDIYRVSPQEISSDASAVFSKLHPDDVDGVVASITESAKNQTLWKDEYRVKFDDGVIRWLSGNAAPQLEDDGSVLWHGFIKDITDRKLAEEELEESREKYRGLSEASIEAIFFSEKGVCIEQNLAAEKMFGYTSEEALTRYGTDWIVPEDREMVMKNMLAGFEEPYEATALRKDGTTFPCTLQGKMMHYKGRDVRVTSLTDITRRKQAEALVEQTKHNYEIFFNTIDDFLFVLDEQGNMIHTNTTVTKKLEYSIQELLGESVLITHPVERREEAGRIVGEMLAGTSDYCPVPLITKSGNYIPVETRVKTGVWDGKPAIFGVSKDISKIKLSEEKFSKAFQSNSALMAISHSDGRLLDVNETFLNTLGYSREEVLDKTALELNLFRDPGLRKRMTEQLEQNIPIREVEVAAVKKDGSEILGLFSADTIYIGKDLCLLTMMVDITARKYAEEEMRKARNEAEKANLAKSEFLSRMSHELRTPMNSILGFAQLMSMGELNPAHKKGVNHIISSGTHLLTLINEILDISRIEAGRITLSLEPVQLSSVIHEMIDIIQPNASKRNLRVEFEQSPSNLLYVKADRQRLKQVLLNLINNAVKYNREEGSVTLRTELHQVFAPDATMVRVSVTDSGVGISQEEFSKLFLPFERIGAERSDTEGTGLGLAVVKKLMDVMGGTVGVESVVGKGSTFWIELPQAEGMEKQIARALEASEKDMISREKKGTILYIEDNISNADLVHEILENHRPAIQLVTSMYGSQAVKLASEIHPDLILLDLDLPDMHGSQVLAKLKEDNETCQIPVAIISADAMPQMVEQLMLAGAEDYLTKPLDIIGFLVMIDGWIKND